ncbi:YcnI family copper-binding membrane protein [Mycobacterium sp. Marseille-P9652]|uniref:YcnI family copper-binding membrane protein n=1 Tax=Mycobacterium sp. Marseille-P9652 TaxID=2654950 RepID=UPI001E5928BC|nr:YcnI family protein [Mycobacterium sp. Marseille-P9652]
MRRVWRVLAAVGVLGLAAALTSPAAWAHVHVSSDDAARGATALLTFQVPNESNTGARTTALAVTLPNVASARTEYLPGWTATLDRDAAAGTVRAVTWTASPDGGIGVDQFALFRISVQLPDADTVSFPATQTYSDGSVVKWDQPTPPGGAEPEHPVPVLTLTAGTTPHDHHPAAGGPPPRPADNTARLLAGAALVLAAAAVFLVLIRRRT